MLRNVIVSCTLTVGMSFAGVSQVHAQLQLETPERMGPNINDDSQWVAGPSLSYDGLELFFSGGPGAVLYSAERDSKAADFGARQTILQPGAHPSVSSDGLSLYYHYNSGGVRKLGVMTRDAIDADWSEGEKLGPAVNGQSDNIGPSITADGLELYFRSDRPGGGGGDVSIWVAERETAYSDWEEPVPLGPHINSTSCGGPDISADGLTLFFNSSYRADGFGGADIWMATRETIDNDWGEPVNLGPEVNTSRSEISPHLSPDGSELYFSRGDVWDPSPYATYDLWRVPVVTPATEDALQAGDADQNYSFDQLDLVQVLAAAKYLTGEPATWGEGDWNGAADGSDGTPPVGDGVFDQLDIIAALNAGTYLQGAYYVPGEFAALSSVPEPSTVVLLVLGIAGVALRRRRGQS